MTRLIAVAGAAPGAGKSTLSGSLRDWLIARRLKVDHVQEEEVLTRREFAPLAREFTNTGEVQLQTLLDTTVVYLDTVEAAGMDLAITDALIPFVPSLMGWGYSEAAIVNFLEELASRIDWTKPTVVYLDDDPALAVARAVEREGSPWLDWLVTKLGQYPVSPAVCDLKTCPFRGLVELGRCRLVDL
ncbi:MAG: hypothetical protein ACRDTA_03560 [Pseudonocardiaceae bacterium]